MAPLGTRQTHPFFSTPSRDPKGPSSSPVIATKGLDPVVFGELFAGTVGIFVIAILFWKIGKLTRSLTRHRVLKEGKPVTVRYARTWYGWVSMDTHERNKAFFSKPLKRIGDWMAWKSTRTDYRWAWWDPKQEALKARQQDKKPLNWLPEGLTSFEFTTADAIWNPGLPANCHGALLQEPVSKVSLQMKSHIVPYQRDSRVALPLHPIIKLGNSIPRSRADEISSGKRLRFNMETSDERSEDIVWSDARMVRLSSTRSQEEQSPPTINDIVNREQESSYWLRPGLDGSMPQLSQFFDGSSSLPRKTPRMPLPVQMNIQNFLPEAKTKARRPSIQRAWSAQMQMKRNLAVLGERDSSGPPGTPLIEINASLSSNKSISLVSLASTIKQDDLLPKISTMNPLQSKQRAKHSTAPARYLMAQDLKNSWLSLKDIPRRTPRDVREIWGTENIRPNQQICSLSLMKTSKRKKIPFAALNDCEVKLMDNLERKLVWNADEATPGIKSYQFSLLANHWLNRATWTVSDPVSRVSQSNRRLRGDPRYNVPYPERILGPTPKYQAAERKRAHIPHISSWRAAVNRQRRMSDIRCVLRTVELYDDSTEEPPDGKTDPSSWMLRKPPQGLEMSDKQKKAWYEGGAGWQEKLDDWQQVHRSYRLNKLIHEGHVNRNRLKEVAANINRCCTPSRPQQSVDIHLPVI